MVNIEDIIFICAVVSLIFAMVFIVYVITAFAQDADPAGYCSYKHYPYLQLCNNQKVLDFLEQFNNWTHGRYGK